MILKIRILPLAFLCLVACLVALKPTQAHAQGQTIYCASDDGARHYCSANTSGGVTMTNQRSGSPCTQGQTWGWDRNGIWVDRGCRAEFLVNSNNNNYGWGGPNHGTAGTIYCASDDGRRNYCSANTRGGVQMTRQRSGSSCTQGQTWGWDNGGIWVDRGCRAEFTTGNSGGGNWGGGSGGSSGTIYCASDDGRRHVCSANTRGGVRLTNQRSGSPCTQGQTWGWDNSGIWVDRGCRAEFTTGNSGGGNWGGGGGGSSGTIYCASDDGRRHVCSANTRGGVRLTNQRSGSPCTQGQTWGWDNSGIWVDRGCRAEFTTGGGGGNWGGSGGGNNGGQTFTCSSNDGNRQYCNVPGGNPNSVVLSRQLSGSPCTQGSTWGTDRRGLWVDKGCRAEFRTNY